MRLFSFGKQKKRKTSFNHNIRKLTIAIPIFAIIIALPALFIFNSYTFNREVNELTEKVIRESREDIEAEVLELSKQLQSQSNLLDSIVKIELNRQLHEITWMNEAIHLETDDIQKQKTNLKIVVTKFQNANKNLFLGIIDTTSTSDTIGFFNQTTVSASYLLNDSLRNNLPDELIQTSNFNSPIESYLLKEIPVTPFILVAGISKGEKQKISKKLFQRNILAPYIRGSNGSIFLLNKEGKPLFPDTPPLDSLSTGFSLKTALINPNGHLFEKSQNSVSFPQALTYTIYLKEFDLLIGNTKYLTSLDTMLKEHRNKKLWQFLNQFLIMSSVLLTMILLSMWYGKRLSNKITYQFTLFMKSFYGLVKGKREIKSNTFVYEEFQSIITMVNDLTKELRGSEKRFRDMAELLPVMLFECDVTGKLTYLNPTSYEIFQYSNDEAIDKYTFDFFIPEDKQRLIKTIEQRITGSIEDKPRYYTAIKKDGSTFDVMIHANNIISDGVITGIRGIITDVSEQIEHERKLKEMFEEAEELNKLMIKREKRVFEIKLEVNDLLKELGRPIKYMATENIYREQLEDE